MPGSTANRAAVVLAAGKGTRMRSATPKVLHRAAGRPLLAWVLAAAREAGCERILAVVGHGAEEIRAAFAGDDDRAGMDGGNGIVSWVLQAEQRGTGHALAQVESELAGEPALLLVLSGDVPLLTAETLRELVARVEEGGAWGAMAVAELDRPGSLGRVLAAPDGSSQSPQALPALQAIVEARDATPEVLAIRRINAGIYALPAPEIFDHLRRLAPDNAQGELYLTDALTAAVAAGRRIDLVPPAYLAVALGVNDRTELAEVHRRLIDRHLVALMRSGVTILEPGRTTIEPGVAVGADTIIYPGVALLGDTRVGGGCRLHQGAWLRDTRLGDGVEVAPYSSLDGAEVEAGCRVGPFARLRPGAILRSGARVGNFVEVKNAELGADVRAGHLAYLGDATVGAGTNIGAGVITCNYDGVAIYRTEIGRGAFIGSDTMLVAPVHVGEGATTGAGSVITKDVPAGELAVGRARQKNLPGGRLRRQRGQGDGRGDRQETGEPGEPIRPTEATEEGS